MNYKSILLSALPLGPLKKPHWVQDGAGQVELPFRTACVLPTNVNLSGRQVEAMGSLLHIRLTQQLSRAWPST